MLYKRLYFICGNLGLLVPDLELSFEVLILYLPRIQLKWKETFIKQQRVYPASYMMQPYSLYLVKQDMSNIRPYILYSIKPLLVVIGHTCIYFSRAYFFFLVM